MSYKSRLMILLVFVSLILVIPVNAADILSRLTHNDQYALALGKVTKVLPTSFEISNLKVISGHRLPTRITIKSKESFDLKPGEKVLISLGRENSGYRIKWGMFRVSSLNPQKLRIIRSNYPPGDKAALEHYIHTNGTENDFFFIFDSAFVRNPDQTFTRIYPELPLAQRRKHFKLMICAARKEYCLTDSRAPGLGLHATYYHDYEGLQFRWETNYGQFSLYDYLNNNRVIPLGKIARIEGWKTVYWSPSLSQELIPKEGIKITVTAEDRESETRYEQAYLEIQAKGTVFRVKL
jgi:hypothetical protein